MKRTDVNELPVDLKLSISFRDMFRWEYTTGFAKESVKKQYV